VDTTLQLALQRNACREGKARLSESTVAKLHAAFEPLTHCTAEKNALRVYNDGSVATEMLVGDMLAAIQTARDASSSRGGEKQRLLDAATTVVQQQVPTENDVVHKFDLALRKKVSEALVTTITIDSRKRSELGGALRRIKNEVLSQFRCQLKSATTSTSARLSPSTHQRSNRQSSVTTDKLVLLQTAGEFGKDAADVAQQVGTGHEGGGHSTEMLPLLTVEATNDCLQNQYSKLFDSILQGELHKLGIS